MSETDERVAVTAPTPEQMRALAEAADESLSYIGDGDWYPQDTMLQQAATALRTAADQLEAVRYNPAAEVLAYNIVNQIADLYYEAIPSDKWVAVRQATNDRLWKWVEGMITGVPILSADPAPQEASDD